MSDIKEAFPSRFEGGVILEADFSGMEVVGLAMLSQDPQLIADLLAGLDMHRKFAAEQYGVTEEQVTKLQRTLTKQLTFLLQYGGGAASASRKLRIDVEMAKKFIELYYGRYQGVKQWQEAVIEAVRASRKPTGRVTKAGLPQGAGTWESPLGRVYTFFEQDPPEWMAKRGEILPTFQPTQMKNYPVQGTATGDVMALFRAMLYRRLLQLPEVWKAVQPINTVHDSVMFDCKSYEDALALNAVIQEVAGQLSERIMETWGVTVPVPFTIEAKIGPRWSSLKELK